ncbi:hypothetical protein ACLOAV_001851 [Pseudogymnoascus australis]
MPCSMASLTRAQQGCPTTSAGACHAHGIHPSQASNSAYYRAEGPVRSLKVNCSASTLYNLKNAISVNGTPLFSDEGQSWIKSQTGTHMTPKMLYSFGLQWQNPRRLYIDSDSVSNNACQLPPRSVVERHISAFCSSFESLVFPVAGKFLFEGILDLVYNPNNVPSSSSARACVYAFLAFTSVMKGDTSEIMSTESYASTAASFIPQILQDTTPEGLQALTTLALVYYFMGDLQSVSTFISIASRLLYSLNAHIDLANDGSSICIYDKGLLSCHLRDLFWVCYSLDKDTAIRTGQPPSICDGHCDLTLPLGYSYMQNRNIQRITIAVDECTVPLYPWDLQLSQIKSKAYDSLYSPSAQRKSDYEFLLSIRTLDVDLEQWRLSLPSDFRPTLSFFQQTPVSANMGMQASMLWLAYYHCVAIIHRASGRCRRSSTDAFYKSNAIASSLSISLDASRSTISYLQTALPVVTDDCFWVIIFYPIGAILALFSNVLSDPLRPNADEDVNILSSIPELFHRIPIGKLTVAEITHLKFLSIFTIELIRLSKLAVQKAKVNEFANARVEY